MKSRLAFVFPPMSCIVEQVTSSVWASSSEKEENQIKCLFAKMPSSSNFDPKDKYHQSSLSDSETSTHSSDIMGPLSPAWASYLQDWCPQVTDSLANLQWRVLLPLESLRLPSGKNPLPLRREGALEVEGWLGEHGVRSEALENPSLEHAVDIDLASDHWSFPLASSTLVLFQGFFLSSIFGTGWSSASPPVSEMLLLMEPSAKKEAFDLLHCPLSPRAVLLERK